MDSILPRMKLEEKFWQETAVLQVARVGIMASLVSFQLNVPALLGQCFDLQQRDSFIATPSFIICVTISVSMFPFKKQHSSRYSISEDGPAYS
jgi:hypothetical protein